jgi:hypothetical protein
MPGSPGHPKGSRNKLGAHFFHALHDGRVTHGVCVIERVRQEDPTADRKTMTSLMPWPDLGDPAGAAVPVRSARSLT